MRKYLKRNGAGEMERERWSEEGGMFLQTVPALACPLVWHALCRNNKTLRDTGIGLQNGLSNAIYITKYISWSDLIYSMMLSPPPRNGSFL